MVDATDDPGAKLVAALQALKDAKAAHALLMDAAAASSYRQVLDSRAAVARSQALLDRLRARKPGVFP